MGRRIKHIQLTSFVLIIIQIVLIAAFLTIYFANLFDLKKYLLPDYVIIGSMALVFIDCIYVWIISAVISTLRRNTDLHAAEVIGSDVQEAYNFAQIGLAVTDDKDIVLWTNDLFKKYLAFGLGFQIGFQTIINLLVVIGLIPVTGVTLPFLSYGGSSLLVSMMSIGIILNISKN